MDEPQTNATQSLASPCKGPNTAAGKAVVSQNATRHGFLSQRLFVGDEDPEEFLALVGDLNTSLRPVGTLELALVEKIAVIMWRQRRLVRAESAALLLQRQPARVIKALNTELLRGYGNEIKAEHLAPFDVERESWCQAALAEFEALEIMDLPTLEAHAPHLYGQLLEDAEEEDPVEFTAKQTGGLAAYLLELVQWCRSELKEARARPLILSAVDHVRDRSLVLSGETLELFSRYQTTLDSHLYKAMRALRDTQEARLRTLDVKPMRAPEVEPQPAPADRHRTMITAEVD